MNLVLLLFQANQIEAKPPVESEQLPEMAVDSFIVTRPSLLEILTGEPSIAFPLVTMILLSTITYLVASLVISIFSTYFIFKPYSKLPAEFQTLSPGFIWLLLIPVVNTVMTFIIVLQVPEAFEYYFKKKGNDSMGDCGKLVGLIWAICGVFIFVPFLSYLASLPFLACMVLFIIKLWAMAEALAPQKPEPKPLRTVV